MALDEALLDLARERGHSVARFYAWDKPALTIGYFTASGELVKGGRAPVRRLTGGGLVEHGKDLTYLLAVPENEFLPSLTAEERYQWIHEALAKGLHECGVDVALAAASRREPGPCFENPVTSDLLDAATGVKIGGGAQRRSRGALIHQGSVRLPLPLRHPEAGWVDHFLQILSDSVSPLPPEWEKEVEINAPRLEQSRYSTVEWNGVRGVRSRADSL